MLMIGWIAIYSATYSYESTLDYFDISIPIVKQTVYIFLALLCFVIGLLVDGKFWHTFAYLIYGLIIFLLIFVLIFGTEIKGAKAWIDLGAFSFQPSEAAKFATTLAIASFLSYYKVKLDDLKYQGYLMLIIGGPCLLILLQPDAGSALTFLSLFILLFIEGLNPIYFIVVITMLLVFIFSILFPADWIYFSLMMLGIFSGWYYLRLFQYQILVLLVLIGAGTYVFLHFGIGYGMMFGLSVLLVTLILLWRSKQEKLALVLPLFVGFFMLFSFLSQRIFEGLQPHQQERIKVWLKPSECDPRGSLYNLLQSKVAIGSGGVFGKGFMQGNMTKLKYVPEQSTDFIFSTIGEEHGFVGSVVVLILFFILISRIMNLSLLVHYKFGSYFGMALAGFLGFHVLINIGMTMGLFPVIGIPLPFISKGGSSLMIFSLMLGIFLRFQSRSK